MKLLLIFVLSVICLSPCFSDVGSFNSSKFFKSDLKGCYEANNKWAGRAVYDAMQSPNCTKSKIFSKLTDINRQHNKNSWDCYNQQGVVAAGNYVIGGILTGAIIGGVVVGYETYKLAQTHIAQLQFQLEAQRLRCSNNELM
jgi:hypothetical protein